MTMAFERDVKTQATLPHVCPQWPSDYQVGNVITGCHLCVVYILTSDNVEGLSNMTLAVKRDVKP